MLLANTMASVLLRNSHLPLNLNCGFYGTAVVKMKFNGVNNNKALSVNLGGFPHKYNKTEQFATSTKAKSKYSNFII